MDKQSGKDKVVRISPETYLLLRELAWRKAQTMTKIVGDLVREFYEENLSTKGHEHGRKKASARVQ